MLLNQDARKLEMTSRKKLFLVTGGLGFIGKNFVRRALEGGHYVTNIDVVNYAADRKANKEFQDFDHYRHLQQDIAALPYLSECDVVVNFAAESHVDNSIADSRQFCHTNFLGTQRLLELVRAKAPLDRPRFVQISTDEVYGDIVDGAHKESDILKPSNPYSATKAAADLLVLGWARTYNIKYNILRMTNNYGMHQYPEKLIPKSSFRLLRGRPALIHGNGTYRRSWLHVEDCIDAISLVIEKGAEDTVYNVNGEQEFQNIDVVRKIANFIGIPEETAITYVPDRVGQDIRYSLDASRIRELG
ncbi:MAG: dTDP-glucose 4,6-dehydratase, partial [Pyrinomonadaceae bacterium]